VVVVILVVVVLVVVLVVVVVHAFFSNVPTYSAIISLCQFKIKNVRFLRVVWPVNCPSTTLSLSLLMAWSLLYLAEGDSSAFGLAAAMTGYTPSQVVMS
jgi:hypothetical protein